MENIALLKCEKYDVDLIEKKIREGFELLGGDSYIRKLIPKNAKVLLKPNMLIADSKESIVITNYKVFEATIRVIKDYTNNISFGDSPGVGDSRKAAERGGFLEVANRYGVAFEEFREAINVKLENSLLCKTWTVAKAPYEADVVITLPKMKVHAMAYFTGAIKNQFGCIPGAEKATWHTRMPNANNFCKMLLDLNSLVNTSFAIMDGIVAMEGNGPKNGTPNNMNTIIMGKSLSAVDSVASYLIGYDNPLEIPALKEAYDSNWGTVMNKDINVLGETLDNMRATKFELCREGGSFYFINPKVNAFLTELMAPNPTLIFEKCVSCNRCREVCPETPKVIEMKTIKGKKVPTWDMKRCIRCFCCQELCPVGAIKTKNKAIGKVIKKIL